MHRPVMSQADACTYCMGSKVKFVTDIPLLHLLCKLVTNGTLIQTSMNQGIRKVDPKIMSGGGQGCDLEPYDQVVKIGVGVGRFGASAPYHLLDCQMSKYHPG